MSDSVQNKRVQSPVLDDNIFDGQQPRSFWRWFLSGSMRPEDLFPTFRVINRFVRESLTAGGRSVLIVMLISVFGMIYLETPLILLLSSLISIMIVAGIVSFLYRPQLSYEVVTPETVMHGQLTEIAVFLKNPRRRSTYDVNIDARRIPRGFTIQEELLPFVEEVPPGGSMRAAVPFRATRRGVCRFPQLRSSSSFPFNLFRFRQKIAVPGELIVLPRFFPLSSFSLPEKGSETAGELSQASSRSAETDQFLGSREFVPGVPVRRWDYASWARLGKPIVREYQSEQSPMASLLVDTFDDAAEHANRTTGKQTAIQKKLDRRFEALLSLTASLVSSLGELGYAIDRMFLGSEPIAALSAGQTASKADPWGRTRQR